MFSNLRREAKGPWKGAQVHARIGSIKCIVPMSLELEPQKQEGQQ